MFSQKKCRICSVSFLKPPSCSRNNWERVRKFCSKKCADISKLDTTTARVKKCVHCNVMFPRPAGSGNKHWRVQQFCSVRCSHSSEIFKEKIRIARKTQIMPTGPAHHAWIAEMPEKKCEWCGIIFEKKRQNAKSFWKIQKFCSKKCGGSYASTFSPKGEKHGQWKGGVSEFHTKVRRMAEYVAWRSAVFARDRYTCQECKTSGVLLNADHINSFAVIMERNNVRTLNDARRCKELWNVNNGNTLCVACHLLTKTFGWGTRRVLRTLHYKKTLSSLLTN